MKQNKQYLQIDLLQLMQALWKKLWIIVLCTVLCGVVGLLSAKFVIPPKYRASAMMYVNNNVATEERDTQIDVSALNAAQSLVDTYIVVLNTKQTLNEVIDKANVDYSYEELRKMIDAEAVNSTEVFEIKVTSHDPQEAAHIADTIIEVLPDRISDIVEGSSVRIADYTVVPDKPYFPNVILFTAAGGFLGLLGSCFGILLSELLNDQIREEQYLTQTYDLPILASIPDLQAHQDHYGYYNQNRKTKQKEE